MRIFKILISLLFLFFLSCTSKKKIIYFQGQTSSQTSDLSANFNPVLKTDDLLGISVTGLDIDAAKPFNPPQITTLNTNLGYLTGAPSLQGYLIDKNGEIEFPVIGKIKLSGLERTAAVELIKGKLKDYITNPIVNIRILNFKITVLGEVKNPGTFTIPNERISLPEAIGLAGDLAITGVRKNVLVIRDIDGKKTEYRVNLTSKELFSSPVYYLNQNDIVYIEPNRAKINSSVINPSNAGIVISAVSLIVSVMVLLTR